MWHFECHWGVHADILCASWPCVFSGVLGGVRLWSEYASRCDTMPYLLCRGSAVAPIPCKMDSITLFGFDYIVVFDFDTNFGVRT